jgi:hypothetical protein
MARKALTKVCKGLRGRVANFGTVLPVWFRRCGRVRCPLCPAALETGRYASTSAKINKASLIEER